MFEKVKVFWWKFYYGKKFDKSFLLKLIFVSNFRICLKSKRWETSVEACLGLRNKSLLIKFTVYFFEGEIASFNVCTSCKEQDGKSYHLHDDKNLEHFFEKKIRCAMVSVQKWTEMW